MNKFNLPDGYYVFEPEPDSNLVKVGWLQRLEGVPTLVAAQGFVTGLENLTETTCALVEVQDGHVTYASGKPVMFFCE